MQPPVCEAFARVALLDGRALTTDSRKQRNERGGSMPDPMIAVNFKDMPVDEELRGEVEKRCRTLVDEFPEVSHVEVTLTPDGVGHSASGHVSGKSMQLATHALAAEPGHAADRLLDTLRQQLRRSHDKRLFSRRRNAQLHNPKREPRAR